MLNAWQEARGISPERSLRFLMCGFGSICEQKIIFNSWHDESWYLILLVIQISLKPQDFHIKYESLKLFFSVCLSISDPVAAG